MRAGRNPTDGGGGSHLAVFLFTLSLKIGGMDLTGLEPEQILDAPP
jgi:hypothetical protein